MRGHGRSHVRSVLTATFTTRGALAGSFRRMLLKRTGVVVLPAGSHATFRETWFRSFQLRCVSYAIGLRSSCAALSGCPLLAAAVLCSQCLYGFLARCASGIRSCVRLEAPLSGPRSLITACSTTSRASRRALPQPVSTLRVERAPPCCSPLTSACSNLDPNRRGA